MTDRPSSEQVAPDAVQKDRFDVPWTRRSPFLYHFFGRTIQLILVVIYRCKWVGRENVPKSGPVLIACNHQSFIDPPLWRLPQYPKGCLLWRRSLYFVARKTLFRNPVLGRTFVAVNAIPVDQDAADTAAMRGFIDILKNGDPLLIFPEGSRTFDGRMEEFKRGMALLVKRSNCPVLPCAVEGVYDTWPRTAKRPKLRGCYIGIEFGKPIPHEEIMRDGADQALRRVEREIDELRLRVRARLREQSGGRFPPKGPADEPSFPQES